MGKPEQTNDAGPGTQAADSTQSYEFGKACEAGGNFADAAAHYQQALALSGSADVFRHDLVVRAIYAMKMANQHEEAIHFAGLEMEHWPDSPDYFFALGDLLLDWATRNPATAMEELMPMVEASWLRCLEIGERPDLAGAVAGRGSYLAAHNLAVMYENLGDAERAAQFRALADGRA